jgi:hypothetical protein
MQSSRLVVFLSLALIAVSNCNAFAHGVVAPFKFPLLKATTLKAPIFKTAVFKSPSSKFLGGLPGVGSQSVRLNALINKSIIFAGYTNGQNQAITQLVGGEIANGTLNGVLYRASAPFTNYPNVGMNFVAALGSNPLNTGPGPFGFAPVPNVPNTLSFTPMGGKLHGSGEGGGVPLSGKLFPSTSGAQRAQLGFYKLLSGVSTNAGINSVSPLGAVTGGQFYGTFYNNFGGGQFIADTSQRFVFAFGNNPYNSTSIPNIPTSQLSSYLTIGGINRTITSAQFPFTFYFAGSREYFGFGLGANAFGTSNIPTSLFGNFIHLAPLLFHK